MNQIVKLLTDKVINLELDIANIPIKFKNEVICELQKRNYLGQDDIEDIRAAKINEMSLACNEIITSGFDAELSDGESHHFSLTTQDQLNLITLSSMALTGNNEIPYHADGELCKYYTAEDINTIVSAATTFKTYHVTYFNSLKSYITTLDNVDDILDVEYGDDIPAEYQSDILKEIKNDIA